MGAHGRCVADAPVAPPETTLIDAVFVERSPVWWVVAVPSRHDAPPAFAVDGSATRTLGAEVVRAALDALETGEGGGFADGTGRGLPPEPPCDVACGVRLVASVRDVATVFLRDPEGRARAVRATRTVESNSRAPPALRRAGTTTVGVGRRTSPASPDPPDPLGDVRRCALLGDASETLRLSGLARARASPADADSLDLVEGQALERLGRFTDAAQSLARFADRRPVDGPFADGHRTEGRSADGVRVRPNGSADPQEPALEARRQAARIRARAIAPDARAASDGRGEAVDAALAALPGLFCAGRALDAFARVADAVRRAEDRPLHRSRGRSRALLAAAALALDAGDRERAGVLLRPLLAGPRSDELRPFVDALRARADAPTSPSAAAPGPPVGESRHGG